MPRNQRNQILENVTITGFASEGKAVTRIGDKVAFVEFGAPGDVADLRVLQDKSSFMVTSIEQLKMPSPERVSPVCNHFGYCGGCKWQHLDYAQQLQYKQEQVEETLQRLGKIQLPAPQPILGSELHYQYRNKLEFAFCNKRWITPEEMKVSRDRKELPGAGFHIPKRWDKILHIEACHLMDGLANEIRNTVYDFAIEHNISFYDVAEHHGCLRQLSLRNNLKGNWMVTVMFGGEEEENREKVLEMMKTRFPAITSLQYIVNTKKNDSIYDQEIHLYHGEATLTETIGNLNFLIGPKSFFQTNSKQTERLYQQALDYAGLKGNETVYDLYCGIGTISLFLAKHAKRVLGIESVPEAIEDAHKNAALNQINNVDFLAGDMKDLLKPDIAVRYGKPDVIVTDPPRAGMHPDVVETLIKLSPEKIVYVSCNVATQARDLKMMEEFYEVTSWRPVDMFPHTAHVENVVLLTKRKS